jgi:hypothetical protein
LVFQDCNTAKALKENIFFLYFGVTEKVGRGQTVRQFKKNVKINGKNI